MINKDEKMSDMVRRVLPEVIDEVQIMYPHINRSIIVSVVFDFYTTHGNRGIIGMYKFFRYAQDKKLDEIIVKSTIYHDINGRHDSLMLPRTDSYADLEEYNVWR